MRILLVANYLPDRQQSMLHIVKMFEAGLKKVGYEVHVIRPDPVFCQFQQSTRGFAKWLGYIDKLVLFPCRIKKEIEWADVIHICDHSNAVYTKYFQKAPHLITCCDLLAIRSALGEFKENHTRWMGRQLQKLILEGINKSQYVVCISKTTKKDLLHISNLKEENISVIYLGLNYSYEPMERSEARNYLKSFGMKIDSPFILHVGKNNWYKNRKGLLVIFKHIIDTKGFKDYKLVLAGEALSKELHILIDQLKIKRNIEEIILPKNEDLKMLYSAADAIIYPSIAEGFGWPIIEAQACGCPVFASNRAPMTEAGGKAAIYFDPDKPEEAAYIICEALKDKGKTEKMRREGFENAKRFSAEEVINQYIEVYKKVLALKT